MVKFKDMIYNISDIIVAISIVLVAGFIIWQSIGNIMEYPSTVAASPQIEENSNLGHDIPIEDTSSSDVVPEADAVDTSDAPFDNYAVYINYGESTLSIAKKFVGVGLFDSVEQFNSLLEQANASTKIKTGNFIIPSDSTPEEVITQITTTSGL